ncbi:hypothetical protein F0U44_11915 [Nocardioides humilatus]|uniref:DUF3592 domain-containing protein n=1 Tax=Nocardioides humilatus TaxID=2607660 RepID=A0A5B1LEJ9_9ACTN|nr:hypothetical protein [Nocardioides humilatus]KAA1419151.1 hypothetical protein F0U44_11915 [Nocardioides humilatus]
MAEPEPTPAPPPTHQTESMTMRVIVNVLVTAILIVPFVLVGAGMWLLAQRQLGDEVEAEVISCDLDIGYKTTAQHCMARWTQDGVEHTGPIQGSGDQEVGKKITATVRGDELYSRSLSLPLILLGLGLPLCFFPFAWLRNRLRKRSAP